MVDVGRWAMDVGRWMGVTLHVARGTFVRCTDVQTLGRLNDGGLRTLDVRGWTLDVQTFERWTFGRADIWTFERWTLKVWLRA